MIIAAYAGCGKTTLAARCPELFVEVASMPYARILPEISEGEPAEFENQKAAPYHINNPLFPYNMVEAILEAEQKSPYVIIPTIATVIDILQKDYGRTVALCYPEEDLGAEYRERYLKRDNSQRFIELFADRLKDCVKMLKAQKEVSHVVLQSREYLSDKVKEIEQICGGFDPKAVTQEDINLLKEKLREMKKNLWMKVNLLEECLLYQIEDLDDPDEKRFIYDLGKRVYYSSDWAHISVFDFDIREVMEKRGTPCKTVDKDGLYMALELSRDGQWSTFIKGINEFSDDFMADGRDG